MTAAIANGVAQHYSGPARQDSAEAEPGLLWLTRADLARVQPDPKTFAYVLNLRLANPTQARTFAANYHVEPEAINAGPGAGPGVGGPGPLDLQPWRTSPTMPRTWCATSSAR